MQGSSFSRFYSLWASTVSALIYFYFVDSLNFWKLFMYVDNLESGFLFLWCGHQGLGLGHQSWPQANSPAEPSWWSRCGSFLYKKANTHTGIFNNWTISCIHVTVQLAWLAKRCRHLSRLWNAHLSWFWPLRSLPVVRQDMIYLSQPSVFIFYRCGDGEELAQKLWSVWIFRNLSGAALLGKTAAKKWWSGLRASAPCRRTELLWPGCAASPR